ncbi:hypothetical protein CRENBAI_006073 [Crenichthys baileyi]|uniref:Uncharacterized protein n=1 Tax=Crenichthys baileyi TaxID=28760 RepID=A0AAV9R7K4_9TELE
MATASFSRQWREGGGAGGGGERRRRERKVETKQKKGGAGPPDLDLDQVEEEVQAEQKSMRMKKEEKEAVRRQQEDEEEERNRRRTKEEEKEGSQMISQKKLDKQERRSKSLPRNGASSWGSSLSEEARGTEMERRRCHTVSRHAMHHGSSAAAPAFSFLMPLNDDKPPSDSESAASFSEISHSAASIASVTREKSDWWRAQLSQKQENSPGLWLKPSTQRLTQTCSLNHTCTSLPILLILSPLTRQMSLPRYLGYRGN